MESNSKSGNRGEVELQVQEAPLKIGNRNKTLIFGIPKESSEEEKRVALTPDAVKRLVFEGHRVIIQKDAGISAFFKDNDYTEYGAEIVSTLEEVYQADIILKITPPSDKEISLLKKGKTILSFLCYQDTEKAYYNQLLRKKANAIAYDFIRDKSGRYPFLYAMSEIVGKLVVMAASYYLSDNTLGNGTLLGHVTGITPTEVVIVGAGTVAINACRTALGMGCSVKVFDVSIEKLRRLQDAVGQHVFTSVYNENVMGKAIADADVLIAAKHTFGPFSPVIVKDDMVKTMKEGSVIIDVSIDQGGCCETSHKTSHKMPVFKKYGMTHYCVPNIASRVPKTSSVAISNYLLPRLIEMGECGGIEGMIKNDPFFAKGVYVFNGKLTNQLIAEKFSLSSQPLELILPTFLGS